MARQHTEERSQAAGVVAACVFDGGLPEELRARLAQGAMPLRLPAAVAAAAAAGQREFGENYVQEAVAKIEALGDAATQGLRDLRDGYRGEKQSGDRTPGCVRCKGIPDEAIDELRARWEV